MFFLGTFFTRSQSNMEYTLEQLNYFRACYIAFNLVPQGLRKVFRQEWNFLYKTTPFGEWKDISQNGRDFYNKESRKSHTKNARLLATIQRGNTAEWDDEHHADVATSYDNLGTVYSHLGQYSEAKENYEKTLIIRKEIYGEHHGVVAASYNNLGIVYKFLGQYSEAKENHEKALIIGKEIYGEHHGDVATSYDNLGTFASTVKLRLPSTVKKLQPKRLNDANLNGDGVILVS